ncbi:D-alanyl-D-alanine carboxypeptidase [Paenarthrobacter nitroguajacolicus]|uniref:serine hydrolase domain-containing protein n=1 Tax=Paenarthrobacter nitroguajacolicus TaxID=211146 RepID=UPI0028542DD4|nr:serine hydrolase domain-containing protein [Paenarthrobacter nitroguajacolicus]MDR6987382.1 D-alanyl-D-alanine carboxypeptidase [Paenarthrobacter nitroguajacolicus]
MPELPGKGFLTLAFVCGLMVCGCTGTPEPLPSQPSTQLRPPATATAVPSTPEPPLIPTVTETPSTPPQDTPTFSPALQELRATLELFSREKIEEGASAVLMKVRVGRQEWTHAAGVRSREGRIAAQPGDRFLVGQQLRTMLAVSVLRLAEEGRLSVDDPVTALLPGSLAPGNQLTIRQLLGTPGNLPGVPSAQADALLGRLVEQLRGSTLDAVLRTDILSPLGLHSTMLLVPDSAAPDDLVHGYLQVNGGTEDITFPAAPGGGASPGGLVTTVQDITTFHAALLKGQLLAPGNLIAMKGTVFGEYGLGLDHWDDRCTNGTYYGHAGDVPGYGSVAISSADGNRQVVIFVAYPPLPASQPPSALSLEMTGVAQVALNSGCRFQFR